LKPKCLVKLAILMCIALTLSACSSTGYRNITTDRFNYNEAIKRSHDQQMLLNIVRLRYLEMPDFLTVSSIITSYNYEGSVGLSGSISGPAQSQGLSANGDMIYAERPTITYNPMTGQEFSQILLKPLPVKGFFALGYAGWPVDILMAIGLQSINDAKNMGPTLIPTPGKINIERQNTVEAKNLSRFSTALKLMLTLIDKGAISVQQSKNKKDDLTLRFFHNQGPATQELIAEFKEILNLDTTIDLFRIVNRSTKRQPDEISIQGRSLMSMMTFLAKGVEVPAQDQKSGKVLVLNEQLQQAITNYGVLRVRSQKEMPKESFVRVKYRNSWFYIADTDITSKRAFTTLQIIFQLQTPSNEASAPLFTLPAG